MSLRVTNALTGITDERSRQFGNMLVLSATYTSSHSEIASLIKEQTLRKLLDRTVKILIDHRQISPVLAKDAVILQHVRQTVFPQG